MRRLVAWWEPEYEPDKLLDVACLLPRTSRPKYDDSGMDLLESIRNHPHCEVVRHGYATGRFEIEVAYIDPTAKQKRFKTARIHEWYDWVMLRAGLDAAERQASTIKSKRVKGGDGLSFQAERTGNFILVKCFFIGKRSLHTDMHFHASHWPLELFEQKRFVGWLYAEMGKRVFNEEDEGLIPREADAIVKAVNEVLGLPGVTT